MQARRRRGVQSFPIEPHCDIHHSAGFRFKAVAHPYDDGLIGMVVVVSEARDGLAAVERMLKAETMRSWLEYQTAAEVDLHLPSFKSMSRFDLARNFSDFGMDRAFTDRAEFPAIVPPSQLKLKISKVIHEAIAEVNQEGTKAAAAKAVVVFVPTSERTPPRQVTLRADRPFLYFIVDHKDGTILFLGLYTGPS